jgi:dTDP-4-amino-4,6-dideoxygalactose transaminase
MTPARDPGRPAIHGGTPALAEPIRFIKPTLPPLADVLARYDSVYRSGVITNAEIVAAFESAVADLLEVEHCVAVSSCTSGLALVLRALGVQGEVILPSFTFFATGHALLWNGVKPVFADCTPDTWTLDPASVESKITPNTAAIVAVHLYGNPCDTDSLQELADEHGLKLIFDSAHAFGSRRQGQPIGSFGDAEVFSLSPTKLLVAGEGGLVATHDAELARLLRAGRNYGDLGAYDPEMLGLNARMSEFNAALGLAGLSLVSSKVARHNAIAQEYTERLSGTPGLSFQTVRNGDVSTYKDYSVLVDEAEFGMSRDTLATALLAENIVTKKYFSPAMHRQSLYVQFWDGDKGALRNTDRIAESVLSLPIYESLASSTIDAIAGAIRRLARPGW